MYNINCTHHFHNFIQLESPRSLNQIFKSTKSTALLILKDIFITHLKQTVSYGTMLFMFLTRRKNVAVGRPAVTQSIEHMSLNSLLIHFGKLFMKKINNVSDRVHRVTSNIPLTSYEYTMHCKSLLWLLWRIRDG